MKDGHSIEKTVLSSYCAFGVSGKTSVRKTDCCTRTKDLIVQHSKRLETLKVLHMGHYAIDKMQLRTLETILARDKQKHCKTVPELQDLHTAL